MNIKAKISISIIITLLMGIVIGAMLNRALVQRRIAKAFALSNPKTFSLWYENRLDLDREQSRQIKAILDKHAKEIWDIREAFMQEMQTASQSLHSELDPLLTPRQKRQLERGPFNRRRGSEKGFRPPPGGMQGAMPAFSPEFRELREALSLTDEQVYQLRSQIGKQSRPQRFPISTRPGMMDPESILRFWQETEKQRDQALQKILDEDQKKIYAQIKAESRQKLIDFLEQLIKDL